MLKEGIEDKERYVDERKDEEKEARIKTLILLAGMKKENADFE